MQNEVQFAGFGGQGIGRAMYQALTDILSAQGFVNAVGVITVPNEASTLFHESMGFHQAAVFPAAGFKLGGWHTVECWWKQLADLPDEPFAVEVHRSFPSPLLRLLETRELGLFGHVDPPTPIS